MQYKRCAVEVTISFWSTEIADYNSKSSERCVELDPFSDSSGRQKRHEIAERAWQACIEAECDGLSFTWVSAVPVWREGPTGRGEMSFRYRNAGRPTGSNQSAASWGAT